MRGVMVAALAAGCAGTATTDSTGETGSACAGFGSSTASTPTVPCPGGGADGGADLTSSLVVSDAGGPCTICAAGEVHAEVLVSNGCAVPVTVDAGCRLYGSTQTGPVQTTTATPECYGTTATSEPLTLQPGEQVTWWEEPRPAPDPGVYRLSYDLGGDVPDVARSFCVE